MAPKLERLVKQAVERHKSLITFGLKDHTPFKDKRRKDDMLLKGSLEDIELPHAVLGIRENWWL